MKRIVLTLLTLIAIYSANAQTIDKAIGIRFGAWSGYNAEISYQHPLSSKDRVEGDLYIHNSNDWGAIGITGLYHRVFNIENGLQWYVGAGGSIGSSNYKNDNHVYDDGFFLAVDGNIGIEYCFDEVPLQIALDFRPAIGLINTDYGDHSNIGFAIRYRF